MSANSPQQDVTTAIPAGAATTVVANGPGRLRKIICTSAGTASTTFFDDPATGQGTVLFVTPTAPALGQIFDVNMPAAKGIVAVGVLNSGAFTVSS
jgi:hypothetical protein